MSVVLAIEETEGLHLMSLFSFSDLLPTAVGPLMSASGQKRTFATPATNLSSSPVVRLARVQ